VTLLGLVALSLGPACTKAKGTCADPAASASAGILLDLPKARASDALPLSVLTVTLAKDGSASLNGAPLANDDAIHDRAAEERRKAPGSLTGVVSADRTIAYGRVVHALDQLRMAGIAPVYLGVDGANPLPPRMP
jgi:biopolymer transport protein ExbD